ncbi:hypothetical protein ABFS83_06G119700 [Erythranthe nasuta]
MKLDITIHKMCRFSIFCSGQTHFTQPNMNPKIETPTTVLNPRLYLLVFSLYAYLIVTTFPCICQFLSPSFARSHFVIFNFLFSFDNPGIILLDPSHICGSNHLKYPKPPRNLKSIYKNKKEELN